MFKLLISYTRGGAFGGFCLTKYERFGIIGFLDRGSETVKLWSPRVGVGAELGAGEKIVGF